MIALWIIVVALFISQMVTFYFLYQIMRLYLNVQEDYLEQEDELIDLRNILETFK
jgi:hypothetical protein